MLKRLLLLGMLGLVLTMTACQNDSQGTDGWDAIVEKGYFVMGLDDTFAPMGFRNSSGELVGFDVELAQEVAARLNLEVRFQPIDWSLKETELNSGNIDVIWNGYSITPSRQEKVAFTEPYLSNKQIIVVLSDSDVIDKTSLAGKSVAVQKESSAYEAVMAESDFVDSLKEDLIQFDTNNEAFMDLEAKRVDAIVVDEVLARYYMSLRGEENYLVLKDHFGEEDFGIGIRKNDEIFLQKINDAMNEIKKDGTYDAIKSKWFSQN